MTSLRLRRAGVIGDVHAEDETLQAVLDFLASVPHLDALLCTGDIVDGVGDANRCCALLLCHGLGDDDMGGVYPGDEGYALEANHRLHALVGAGEHRFVVNGHTHQRMVRTVGGLTILNAGTLRADHQPGFFVADFEAGAARFYDVRPGRGNGSVIEAAQIVALPEARA